jgi:hypothetical protein
MKSWVSMLVVACLLGPNTPAFAQFSSLENSGPIARSAAREAVRFATLVGQAAPVPEKWEAVRRISGRTVIEVRKTNKSDERGYFMSADAASLTVLTIIRDLKRDRRDNMLNVAAAYANYLTAWSSDRVLVVGDVKVARGAVFIKDEKVAVTVTIPAEDVVEVRQHATSQGSPRGALIGTGVGFAAGMIFLAANIETRCQPNCGYITLAPLYMPSAGAALGYFGAATRSDGVIYQR